MYVLTGNLFCLLFMIFIINLKSLSNDFNACILPTQSNINRYLPESYVKIQAVFVNPSLIFGGKQLNPAWDASKQQTVHEPHKIQVLHGINICLSIGNEYTFLTFANFCFICRYSLSTLLQIPLLYTSLLTSMYHKVVLLSSLCKYHGLK